MTDRVARLAEALTDRYRIEREVGAGGMATVYLAEDLRHRRRVALKMLRPELGAVLGPDRFLAEIEVTANLQHPHLLPLFDSGEVDGLLFYVMPYVDGESLRQRLDRERQLPVDEALRIVTTIAGALDYAHRHGVIHRDLKPENILLHDGQPLVADFGIALAVSNAGGGRITQTGLSLGTPLYMSPEQATGDRVIDGRSDIYALGAMLYEMLTGEAPHAASTSQAIIARLLTEKPRSVRAVRPSVPAHVEASIDRALEKLPADRFATGQEFADVLTGRTVIAASPAEIERSQSLPATTWPRVLRHPLTLAILAAAVLGWGGFLGMTGSRAVGDLGSVAVHFEFTPEQGRIELGSPFTFTADGSSFVFNARQDGYPPRLYIRQLNASGSTLIPGSDNAGVPAFSPDGAAVAWLSGGFIYRANLDGSLPTRVGTVPHSAHLAWAGNEFVVGSPREGLRAIPVGGGTPRILLPLDTLRGEISHFRPLVLGDAETVLYTSWTGDLATARIGALSLRTGRTVLLDVSARLPIGMIDDVLIYHDGRQSVMGVPVNLKTGKSTGTPAVLLDSVSTKPLATPAAISHAGSLIYLKAGQNLEFEFVELGMSGDARPGAAMSSLARGGTPRYSPDGRRILIHIATDTSDAIWLIDRRTGTFTPFTRGIQAEWSPNGRDVLFVREAALWRQRSDGTAPPERVQRASERGQIMQGMFSPDSRYLIYHTGSTGGDDVWYRAWSGDTMSQPLAADPSFLERNPAISPDGRWAAYASNESGSFQVYVRPFPGPGPRHAVTVDGGDTPVWSRDGRRLFYVAGERFEQATLTFEPEFSAARRPLLEHHAITGSPRNWDIAPDESHFLVVRPAGGTQQASRVVVIHNWAADVRARFARERK